MGVRWGVAGTGGIATRFASAMDLVVDGSITAVGSRSVSRADEYADRFDVPRRYASYEALAEDPEVEVVYVATPNSRHHSDAMLFLEAGKHVLCEKPLALDAVKARRMADSAGERGLFLMEALWSRFLPSYRALAEIVADGRIGEPRLVEGSFGFAMPVDPSHRLFDPSLGGGAVLDVGVYPLQLCSMVLGPPDRVSAEGHVGETGVDEQVAALLHHPGGALGVVEAAIRTNLGNTARISGDRGSVEIPAMMHCPDHLVVTTGRGTERLEGAWEGDGLRFQIDEVHRCVADGSLESPTIPLDESIGLARTMDAVRVATGVRYPGQES